MQRIITPQFNGGGKVMNSCYSSNKIMEEIKYRIKDKFKNQENFGKELGASRKTVSRILNHGTDIVTFFKICKILGINGAVRKPKR